MSAYGRWDLIRRLKG